MSPEEARDALRTWIRTHNPAVPPGEPADDSRIIERRYLTSLQVADLLLYIEELRQEPVHPSSLRPGAFATIDSIHAAFFQ